MDLAETFDRDGFVVIHDMFGPGMLDRFEAALVALAAKKAREHGVAPAGDSPQLYLRDLERCSRRAFYETTLEIGGTLAAVAITAAPRVRSALGRLAGDRAPQLLVGPAALFWNDAGAERLQYDWHQETAYFPDYARGWHLWFPLFRDVGKNDGPMRIAVGSHRHRFPYRYEERAGGFSQLIPLEDIEARFPIVECCIPRGAAVIFDHGTVHCTGENRSGLPRTSGIARYLDAMGEDTFRPIIGFSYRAKAEDGMRARAVPG